MQLEKEQQQQQSSAPAQYDDFGLANTAPFVPQRSFSSGSTYQQHPYSPPSVSPMPLAQPYTAPAAPVPPPTPTASDRVTSNELDLNDPSTLEIYSRILLFKDDRMRDELAFSRTLTPQQRRVVHLIAQKLGVYHYSVGEGEERYAVVTRIDPNRVSPHLSRRKINEKTSLPSTATTYHATHPLPCSLCLSLADRLANAALTPSQKVHAGHEDVTLGCTAPQLPLVQRQHPRRLRHPCHSHPPYFHPLWLPVWLQ